MSTVLEDRVRVQSSTPSAESPRSATEWWDRAYFEQGPTSMDKLISRDATWEEIVDSAEKDLVDAFAVGGMNLDPEGDVLEIGCGVGRLSHALARRSRHVFGADIAPKLLDEARRKQSLPNISYHLLDGTMLVTPELRESLSQAAARGQSLRTVYSYEVLYYVPAPLLKKYFREALEVLAPGGEIVFQLNCEPISARTRVGFKLRDWLYACGITQWRGWPTHPEFRRLVHPESEVRAWLLEAGFEQITSCGTLRQKWFRGIKPE